MLIKKEKIDLRGDKLKSCRLLDEIMVMKTAKNGFWRDFGVFLIESELFSSLKLNPRSGDELNDSFER